MKSTLLKNISRSKPLLILVISVVITAVLIATKPEQMAKPVEERAWVVDTVAVQPSTQIPNLQLFGRVLSPQDADLSAGIEAVVVEVMVSDGDSVGAGQVLALLDDRDAKLTLMEREADLQEVRAQFSLAERRAKIAKQAYVKELSLLKLRKKRFTRSENLFKQKSLSRSDYEEATENFTRQELAAAQAQLLVGIEESKLEEFAARITRFSAIREKAALDVERSSIVAPFPGVVSDLTVSLGDRVRKGDALMRLQNPAAMEIRAQLPTRYARLLRDGLDRGLDIPIKVQHQDEQIIGHLLRVSGQTRENSGGVDGFMGFDEAPLGLNLGATVQLFVDLPPQANVIAVPAEAIYGSDNLYIIDEDSRMKRLTVERVGEKFLPDGRTLILIRSAGLKDGDQIIATKLANAANGLRVERVVQGQASLREDAAIGILATASVQHSALRETLH